MLTTTLEKIVFSFLEDSLRSLFEEMIKPSINRCVYKTALSFETRLNNKFDKILVLLTVFKTRVPMYNFPFLRKINVDLLVPDSLQPFTCKKCSHSRNHLCFSIRSDINACGYSREETLRAVDELFFEINACVPDIFQITRRQKLLLKPVAW